VSRWRHPAGLRPGIFRGMARVSNEASRDSSTGVASRHWTPERCLLKTHHRTANQPRFCRSTLPESLRIAFMSHSRRERCCLESREELRVPLNPSIAKARIEVDPTEGYVDVSCHVDCGERRRIFGGISPVSNDVGGQTTPNGASQPAGMTGQGKILVSRYPLPSWVSPV
jgi:hypothetical protein